MSVEARGGRDGGVRLRLAPAEVAVLRELPAELAETYDADEDDVVRRRLFPSAYLDPTEEASEAEWRELVHPTLRRGRLDALEVVRAALAEVSTEPQGDVVLELTASACQSWLGVLNDARLALGTRLGVTQDLDVSGGGVEGEDELGDDLDAPARAVYAWLTVLEGEFVEALLDGLDSTE